MIFKLIPLGNDFVSIGDMYLRRVSPVMDSVGSVKTRMEILLGNEAEGLTVDGLNRSGGELLMQGDRQDLGRAAFELALELGVAASN